MSHLNPLEKEVLIKRYISSLKYFCENEKPFKIICAGSLLGVKINRFNSSFPVGKVQMINMYPMSFHEFILANMPEMGNVLIDEIKKCYNENKNMDSVLHDKLINLYRIYMHWRYASLCR